LPDWLLERGRRAEKALVSVVATSYLLGVSTRRMERLVEQLGITRLSKSQESVMARELDEQVGDFRSGPLDAGPYTFLAADALTMKVREGGRVVGACTDRDRGQRRRGLRDPRRGPHLRRGWCRLAGVLPRPDRPRRRGVAGHLRRHTGLVAALGRRCLALPGSAAAPHYAANLMTVCPKASWGWVKALLQSSMTSPTPPRCAPSSTGSPTRSPTNCPL
jgi:putative transposase